MGEGARRRKKGKGKKGRKKKDPGIIGSVTLPRGNGVSLATTD